MRDQAKNLTKILYIITISELGGAQRYVADLAINLPKNQYEVAVAAGGNGPLFDALAAQGIAVYRLKSLVREINPLKDIAAYFEIKKLIKKIKPDIVHLNSSKAGFIGSFAAKSAGVKKVIYTVHGFVFNEPMAGWKKALYKTVEKYSARAKDVLVCVSKFDQQVGITQRIADPKKLVTIHNGISEPIFLDRNDARRALNLPLDKPVVGTVANFYPTKDLPNLVRAMQLVRQQFSAARCAIIGDGEERNTIEAEIKKSGLEQTVTLCGQYDQSGQYLNRHFKIFDIYICSSVKEGLPFSMLEAMAAGLPIVSTNVGGMPEIIQDGVTGLLVEPRNPKALADAIIKLLSDKQLADRLGEQAKQTVQAKFSLEQMVQATMEVYQS